jgi:predicted heme/steroid binding protein
MPAEAASHSSSSLSANHSFPPSLYHRLSTNPYVVYPLVALLFLSFHLTLSWLFTRSLTFGLYRSAASPRTFTPSELSQYDGRDGGPIYLAILGDVFDVTAGRKYYGQQGGGYAIFAGRDGSRAFITGCFDEHGAVHDVRGLSEREMDSLKRWRDFYAEHAQYRYVGTLLNPAVADDAPLPLDLCKNEQPPAT